MADRFYAALGGGFLALFIVKAMGVPFWRPGFDIGDQADTAVAAFCLIWCAIGALRPKSTTGAGTE